MIVGVWAVHAGGRFVQGVAKGLSVLFSGAARPKAVNYAVRREAFEYISKFSEICRVHGALDLLNPAQSKAICDAANVGNMKGVCYYLSLAAEKAAESAPKAFVGIVPILSDASSKLPTAKYFHAKALYLGAQVAVSRPTPKNLNIALKCIKRAAPLLGYPDNVSLNLDPDASADQIQGVLERMRARLDQPGFLYA